MRRYVVGGLVAFAIWAAWLMRKHPTQTPVGSPVSRTVAWTFVDQEGPRFLGETFKVYMFGLDTLDYYGGRWDHAADSLQVRALNMAEVP